MKFNDLDDGLKYALCALSFFRTRHRGKPRFKKSRRHVDSFVSVYKENVRMARRYVKMAREAGWRGSIVEAIKGKDGW